ncbi:MAG: hypothetical protein ACPGVB_06005 [Chitinophagales bacterium]
MNARILLNILFVFLLASCSKDTEVVQELDREVFSHSKTTPLTHSTFCNLEDATIEIVPFCSADPANFPETAFPISVILNGERIFTQGYTYEWSTGSNGSAITISYNELPVSLILTDDETGCQITLTLDQSYWGKKGDDGVVPVNNNHLPTHILLPEGSTDGGIEGEDSKRF